MADITEFSNAFTSCERYCVSTVRKASRVGSNSSQGMYLGVGKIAPCVLNAVENIQSSGSTTTAVQTMSTARVRIRVRRLRAMPDYAVERAIARRRMRRKIVVATRAKPSRENATAEA